MGYKLSKSKRIQAVIVLAIAALLVMTGTFAWYSFTQRKINVFNITSVPNVNLHDDFAGGPEKDVYVENSGIQPALVRVRLTELLNQNGVLLPDGAIDDETAANWHVHTPSENGCELCDFAAHEYFKWTMNGHKFYMPAPDSAKGSQVDDATIEPLAVGDLDAVIDYAKLLRTEFAGDSLLLSYIDEYLGGDTTHAAELQTAIKAISEENAVSGVRQYNGQPDDELVRKLNEVRLTLIPTQIITMQDWMDGTTYSEPFKTGNFWVVDADGWCYWANALQSGEATGQLLSNVENVKNYSGELIYRINVVLNATTFANTELNDFFSTAQANGGIGEDGMRLMLMASGDYVMGGDGELYLDIGGVYRPVEKNDGSYINHTLGDEIYAGADGIPGNGDDLKAGDTFSLDEDGGLTEGGDYTIEGFTVGENGVVYFNVGNGAYIVSVDESGNPDKNGTRYAQVSAGKDEKIGTEDDESIESRYFYHIGNGVYVEVETKGATEPKSEPVTYYFAGTEIIIENQTENPDHPRYEVNSGKDSNIQDKINAVFPLQLTVGDGFDVILAPDGDGGYYIDKIISGGTEYEMQTLDEDENGDLRILLGDDGYIGVDSETGVLGGGMGEAGGTSGGVFVLPKPTGKGTQENPFLIRTRTDMDWVSAQTLLGNVTAATYYQIADDVTKLDMTTTDFTPIGNDTTQFSGHFDGNNKTIINLTVNRSGANYVGLFGYIGEGGEVKDLTLEAVSVTGLSCVGGIAGWSDGTIQACTVSGTVNGNWDNAAGIVGSNSGEVTGCINKAVVTNTRNNTGGVVGYHTVGTVKDSFNTGKVSGFYNTGGIVGGTTAPTARIENCTNSGEVTSSDSNIGGVVGLTHSTGGTVIDCSNSGDVSGTGAASHNVGGIVGSHSYASGTVTNCSNSGDVSATGNNVGGVVGYSEGTVQLSYSTGDISGYGFGIGGVVGRLGNDTGTIPGTLTNCYAWGNITSETGNAGGVVGAVGYNSTASYIYHANGTVMGLSYGSGGIAGLNSSKISNAVALANEVKKNVGTGENADVGRIAGRRSGSVTVTEVYASSSMIIGAQGFYAETGVDCAARPTQDWWSGTAKLNFITIWRWDSGTGLPVLTGEIPDGSPENPYLIRTRADLEWMSSAVSSGEAFAGKYFTLVNNIDFGGASFLGIGSNANHFKGVFDGGDNKISNMTILSPISDAYLNGLFGINDGTIKNLTLENASIAGYQYTGGLTGINNGTIDNCTLRNCTVNGTNAGSGGITSTNNAGAIIKNCTVTGTSKIFTSNPDWGAGKGAIAGGNSGEIINCETDAQVTVSGIENIGGIVGGNSGTVSGCINRATASTIQSGTNIGGIVGNNNGTVSGCTNTGIPAAQVGNGNAPQ